MEAVAAAAAVEVVGAVQSQKYRLGIASAGVWVVRKSARIVRTPAFFIIPKGATSVLLLSSAQIRSTAIARNCWPDLKINVRRKPK
jgi:hypothetical protein